MCDEQCGNCKHYVEISDYAGECHRNPPICKASIVGVFPADCTMDERFDGIWPSVPIVGRCGEFLNAV